MALYSEIKYKSIRGAGFQKEADLDNLKLQLRGQMDRQIGEDTTSATTQFYTIVGGALASTTTFDAIYDGGDASG